MPHAQPYGLRIQMPNYDAFEGRASGGAGDGAAGAGGGAGASAGTSGGGGAFKITADSLVDFGDGKPVKWGDTVDKDGGRFMSSERFDRGVIYLKGEAGKLQAAWDKYHAGEGARPKQAEPAAAAAHVDPMADIRDLAMVDGRTLEKLYKNLYAQGLAPIANLLASTIAEVKGLKEGFGKFSKTTGTLAEREANNDFERMITDSYSGVGDVKGLPNGAKIDPANDFLRDVAKDVYLSHEQSSWREGEFPKALNARIEKMVGFVRALDKQALDAAKEQKRVWVNPNRGGARGTGTGKFKFQRGADVAKMFFDGAESART